MLEITDIHTYYGESHVLHGVDMEVKDGTVVTLLGRNGMGKTTTIRSIMGLTPPRRGSIKFDGTELVGMAPEKISRVGIGLVPQGRMIFPSLSVTENLTMAARTGDKQDPWTLEKVYETFPRLKERGKNKGNLLSGGEQQMLTVCRTLMGNPDLLLMDEPVEGVAPLVVRDLGTQILRLKDMGETILFSEQNVKFALMTAERAYVIDRGRIPFAGSISELSSNDEVKQKYLMI